MTILDTIRRLSRDVDFGVDGAKEKLNGAIIRLRRQNPWMLRLPAALRRVVREEDN